MRRPACNSKLDTTGATKQPDGQISSDLQNLCQAQESKIFLFTRTKMKGMYLPIPSWSEGRRPSSRTLGGLRWTLVYASTTAWTKRTAKPCGPGARCRRQAVG